MPRWNRRARSENRRLRGLREEEALLNALRAPTEELGDDNRRLAELQARLMAMWGDRDTIPLDELVAVHEAVRAADPSFFGHGRDWRGAFLHDAVGDLVGWGLRLGIVAEETRADGISAFRMVRRDPLFERMGDGTWRRLDIEGVRAKSARGATYREGARVRHAERVAYRIHHHIRRLCEKNAAIPDAWFRFPEFARLKGLAERVADARPTFEEAHRGMHLADQKSWLKMVEGYNYRTAWSSSPRMVATAPIDLPEGDDEALAGLI